MITQTSGTRAGSASSSETCRSRSSDRAPGRATFRRSTGRSATAASPEASRAPGVCPARRTPGPRLSSPRASRAASGRSARRTPLRTARPRSAGPAPSRRPPASSRAGPPPGTRPRPPHRSTRCCHRRRPRPPRSAVPPLLSTQSGPPPPRRTAVHVPTCPARGPEYSFPYAQCFPYAYSGPDHLGDPGVHGAIPRFDDQSCRQHPAGEAAQRHGRYPGDGPGQGRVLQPRRVREGPHRAAHDRGGRAERGAEARRHDRRADQRQHGRRPRHRRPAEGLQVHLRMPGQGVHGQDQRAARVRRGGRRLPHRR